MPRLAVIASQTKEKQRGASMVPKDPSLNRVKAYCKLSKCHLNVHLNVGCLLYLFYLNI